MIDFLDILPQIQYLINRAKKIINYKFKYETRREFATNQKVQINIINQHRYITKYSQKIILTKYSYYKMLINKLYYKN